MMTLFTEAMSNLPSNQFAYSMLIPFTGHHFQARDALRDHDLGLVHAAHPGERLAQPIEFHSRCDGKRQTRKIVDRRAWRPHAECKNEPHCHQHSTYREYCGSPIV